MSAFLNSAVRFFTALNPSALLMALSAIALGHAIQTGDGFYNPIALQWTSISLGLAVFGAFCHRLHTGWTQRGSIVLCVVMAASITWQISELLTARPGFYLTRGNLVQFKAAVGLQGIAVAAGLLRVAALKRVWFPTLLVASLFLGVWTIKASPTPYIDVVVVHKEAIDALLDGKNPYRISIRNIYEKGDTNTFYNPAAVFGDRVNIAYPYPPPSLLLAIPGQVLFGDYRYSEVALLLIGAALIGYARRGLVPKLAAALLLTTPRIWFVIEQGWTEPIAIFLLALAVFLLIRRSVPAAFVTGILIVSKQYLGFAGLAAVRQVFMRPRSWRWIALAGVVAAAAMTLPFYLWHQNAFMRNVVWLQTLEPFRPDSLSFLSWAARNGYGNGSYLWAVGAAIAMAVLTLFTTRNTPSGFASAIALTTFAMFAFGSKAFCNYYFFVIGALCCAIAAWRSSCRR